MKKDKQKWNARFSSKVKVAPKPPGFIKASVNCLKPGSVLDVASGDGAAALYLAAHGFMVTAIDVSDIALERLQYFAAQQDLVVTTYVVDLDEPKSFAKLGLFDNIVITHFKPEHHHWPLLVSLLRSGGSLLLSTFNITQHEESRFPSRFCLMPNELKMIDESLRLEHYASAKRGNNYMDDYRFRCV